MRLLIYIAFLVLNPIHWFPAAALPETPGRVDASSINSPSNEHGIIGRNPRTGIAQGSKILISKNNILQEKGGLLGPNNLPQDLQKKLPLKVMDLDLYFEGKRKEITVQKDFPSLKAYAEIRFDGSGPLHGYWEVDGKIIAYVRERLMFVKRIVIETPASFVPTFDPGKHRLRFVVTRPNIQVRPQEIAYFVLPAGFKETRDYVPNQIIAAFKEKAFSTGYLQNLKRRYNLEIIDEYSLLSVGLRVILFKTAEEDIFRIIEAIKKERLALIAQPNQIFLTMSDPFRKSQYGNDSLHLEKIHSLYRGRGVKVAILDTGIDTTHEDLKDRIVSTRNFVRGEQYVSEIHGTAVGGIVSASINGFGIEGVAPDAGLFAFRSCRQKSKERPQGECFTDSLSKALDASLLNRVHIINMSFGGEEDELLVRLIEAGLKQNVLFVAPVGNERTTKVLTFPASYKGVVSVGGFDESQAPYPNTELTSQALVNAPAVNIITTFPNNKHNFLTGTSLSSAYVSGILSLALEKDKSISRQRLPAYRGNLCQWQEELLNIMSCGK